MFTEPYLANITIFAGNFAPRGWAFCQGQLISIAENSALFSLIGTTFGGDGQTTFGLPDLRGRVAIHAGQAPGMNSYQLGESSGTENVTLLAAQLPPHTHAFVSATGNPTASNASGTVGDPTNAVPAVVPSNTVYSTAASGSILGVSTCITSTPATGNNFPVSILSPYLAMNYIIALEGIYPSRN